MLVWLDTMHTVVALPEREADDWQAVTRVAFHPPLDPTAAPPAQPPRRRRQPAAAKASPAESETTPERRAEEGRATRLPDTPS